MRCRDVLTATIGTGGAHFRQSQAPTATPLVRRLAAEAGYPVCLSYDVDSLDYTDPGPTAVRANVARARPGSIVSMHFGHAGTVEAMPGILDRPRRSRPRAGDRHRPCSRDDRGRTVAAPRRRCVAASWRSAPLPLVTTACTASSHVQRPHPIRGADLASTSPTAASPAPARRRPRTGRRRPARRPRTRWRACRRCSTRTTCTPPTGPAMLSPRDRGRPGLRLRPGHQQQRRVRHRPAHDEGDPQVPGGHEPQHVVPSWDLRTLYVTADQPGRGSLTPIDPRTGRPGQPIPVDDAYNMYFTPNGTLRDRGAGGLHAAGVLRPAHVEAARPLTLPGVPRHRPHGLHRRRDEAAGQLRVRQPDGRRRRRHAHADPHDRACTARPTACRRTSSSSPDGRVFYVADMMANGVYLIDAHTFRVIGFQPTGARRARPLRLAATRAGCSSPTATKAASA